MSEIFYYNVIVSESEPTRPVGGWIWIKPSIGQAYIFVNDSWKPFAGGQVITSYIEGNYWRKTIHQNSAPAGEIGSIWIKVDDQTAYIFLDGWQAFSGG